MNTSSATASAGRRGASSLIGPIDVLLLLVAVIWGGSYSAAKIATEHMGVLQFLVLRFGLTFAVLRPALRGLATPSWPAVLAGASLLGINLLAVFVCGTFGVSLTTASNAAFLISLCVAFTPCADGGCSGSSPRVPRCLQQGCHWRGRDCSPSSTAGRQAWRRETV